MISVGAERPEAWAIGEAAAIQLGPVLRVAAEVEPQGHDGAGAPEEAGEVGRAVEVHDGVDAGLGVVAQGLRAQQFGEVPARRRAEGGDPARVDPVVDGVAADPADRLADVVEVVGPGRVAGARQDVFDRDDRVPPPGEPGDLAAVGILRPAPPAAAVDRHDRRPARRRAVRLGGGGRRRAAARRSPAWR